MNIDALPHNQDWLKTLSWDLPAYKSQYFNEFVDDLDHFKTLPIYEAAVSKGLIVDDKWRGPRKGYCPIKKY